MVFDSKIISIIINIFKKAYEVYNESTLICLLEKFSVWLKTVFSQSSIWRFIANEGIISKASRSGTIYKILWNIVNFPSNLLKGIVAKYEDTLEELRVYNTLKNILRRFEILSGILIMFMLIIPHSYWNNAYSLIIAIFLFIMYFLKTLIFGKDENFSVRALDFSLVLFFAAIAVSYFLSADIGLSGRFFIFHITNFLIFFVIVSSIRSVYALYSFIEIILAGVTLTGLYGIYQFIVGVAPDPSLTDLTLNEGLPGRIFSTMGNANNYAEILVIALPFYFAVIEHAETRFRKVFLSLMAVPSFIALIFTISRSAWMAFVLSVFVILFFRNKKLIPLFILLGFMCIPFLPDFVYKRILTIFNPNDTSAAYRVAIYSKAMPMLNDFWLSGVGLGTDIFRKLVTIYGNIVDSNALAYYEYKGMIKDIEMLSETTGTVPPHTHNLFLQIWIETGLMGILLFIWYSLRTVKGCIINIVNNTDEAITKVLIAGVASISGIYLMGLAEYVWFYPRVMVFFWIMFGIIASALAIIARRKAVFE